MCFTFRCEKDIFSEPANEFIQACEVSILCIIAIKYILYSEMK